MSVLERAVEKGNWSWSVRFHKGTHHLLNEFTQWKEFKNLKILKKYFITRPPLAADSIVPYRKNGNHFIVFNSLHPYGRDVADGNFIIFYVKTKLESEIIDCLRECRSFAAVEWVQCQLLHELG